MWKGRSLKILSIGGNHQKVRPEKKCMNYYPFGLKHKGYNNVVSSMETTAQKFGYNGKELNENLV